MRPGITLSVLLCASACVAAESAAKPRAGSPGSPAMVRAASTRASAVDIGRRLDVNRINLLIANDGSFPPDPRTGDAGLEYPRGARTTVMWTAGLWLGARVGGETRVAKAHYQSEYGPGAMLGSQPDDPAKPEYRVYKVVRWTGLAADSAHVERTPAGLGGGSPRDTLAHHSWSEYMAGAAPHGAPWRVYRLPDTATADPADSLDVPGPDVMGDQMLWSVYNDADPALHTADGGGTAPLGVEVRQTTFAFDRPGPLGSTVFVRYQTMNKGGSTIEDLYATMWGDFDVGSPYDDLAGCMESRSLGFVYNGPGTDAQYGDPVPAIGFDLLAEHYSASLGRNTGMDAFVRYTDDSSEPSSADGSYNAMRGLETDWGLPVVDPATGQPTTFMMPGDPVLGTGWLDRAPTDRRVYCSSGPWTLGPGDSLTFWVALVIGQGESRLASVAALRCADDYIQAVFRANFAEPFAAPPACAGPPLDCPRSADWWGAHCAAGSGFGASEWLAIAHYADSTSAVFDLADPGSSAEYCALLSGPKSTARDSAKREYLALLSNVAAGELGLVPSDGEPARLALSTYLSIPPLEPNWVRLMIQDKPDSIRLTDAFYDNRVTEHRRAYTGVNVGLPHFFGGAGSGQDFLGGTLDPAAMPDSFSSVELRFSTVATQKAYRFLRLEQADGTVPSVGHAYRYGGFHDVPFTCWDTDHGVQLDVAFVERTLTDAAGTSLPAIQQPATRDSTWGPDASGTGAREYLFVLRRPYDGTAKSLIARDGAVADSSLPVLYALWARLRDAYDVVDDGDVFRFVHGYPTTGSAERLFQWLEPLPPADSSAVRSYRAFAAAAADVNRGFGIGAVCGDPTPVAGTLIDARTEGGWHRLRWRLAMPATTARLEARNEWGAWLDVGPARVEGNEVAATYPDFGSGRQWYRLAIAGPIGLARTEPVSMGHATDPPVLSLFAVWPTPSTDGRPRLEFTLPGYGTVRLETYDAAGRRVAAHELPGMQPGTHYVEVAPDARLRPGVYFVQLRFGGERRSARLVVLR